MKFIIFIFFFSLSFFSSAQLLEYGVGFGNFGYAGDLERGYKINSFQPAFQLHHRFNFSEHLSVRLSLHWGKISGSDRKPIDALARERNATFDITVFEFASTAEYHFLDYKHKRSLIKWSPYLFFGVGFARLGNIATPKEDYSRVQPVIPYGIGFKHLVGKRFSVGIEAGMRMMFFDLLDNISDGDQNVKNFRYGNPNDRDFYFFTGISVSYIVYKIPCPFPYVPNRDMLRTKFR